MKRSGALVAAVMLLSLLMAWQASLAAAAPAVDARVTPGAKATEKALERLTQDPGRGPKEHFKGVIAAVSAASLTLALVDGTEAIFQLAADTRIHIPGSRGEAGWDSLDVGMQASVQALRTGSGTLLALRVMQVPGKPVRLHRVGRVTDYQPGVSITVQGRDGQSTTFRLADKTKILPAERAGSLSVGSWVTVIAPRDPSGADILGHGIVVHPSAPGP